MTDRAQELVDVYGDDAFHAAVRFAASAVAIADKEGAEMFAAAARELLQLGYDKRGTGLPVDD